MNSPDPNSLERLLDAAGRAVQPSVPGWETLPGRLAQTPQLQQLNRWGTLPIGVAAVVAMALIGVWAFHSNQTVQAQEKPIEVQRQSVDLTILSVAETRGETLYMPIQNLQGMARPRSKLTGQALVKDRRLVLHLKAGDNVVRFTDIAATIDPTSVRFESLTDPGGTTVVEQSFEYDLATADALLKRFIDREIVCVEKGGQEIAGYLASYDESSIVLASNPKDKNRSTQTVSRGSLQAVRLPEMPGDLISRPTLVWKLRTKTVGKHETLLSYICGYMQWHADYVIELTPGEPGQPDLIDLNGWVTLENTSGSTYPNAGLRLMAGDVRRVRDPWSEKLLVYPVGDLVIVGDVYVDIHRPVFYQRYLGDIRKFAEQSLFEYHLYTLNTPCTVADHQIKQLSLLKKQAAKATRRYIFDPRDRQRNLAIELLVKNEKENNLGMPLPKGSVTLQQRGEGGDGELAVVGQCDIDHTAVKEELKLRFGHAFDVIGEHREVGVEKIGKDQRITYETKIRNHKTVPVAVKCFALRLPASATLLQSSLPHQSDDGRVYFEFQLAANAEQSIRYVVEYRSEK